jgi:hypothetical protein
VSTWLLAQVAVRVNGSSQANSLILLLETIYLASSWWADSNANLHHATGIEDTSESTSAVNVDGGGLCLTFTRSTPPASLKNHSNSQCRYSFSASHCWNTLGRMCVIRRKIRRSNWTQPPPFCHWHMCLHLRTPLNVSKWFVVGITPSTSTPSISDAQRHPLADQLFQSDKGIHVLVRYSRKARPAWAACAESVKSSMHVRYCCSMVIALWAMSWSMEAIKLHPQLSYISNERRVLSSLSVLSSTQKDGRGNLLPFRAWGIGFQPVRGRTFGWWRSLGALRVDATEHWTPWHNFPMDLGKCLLRDLQCLWVVLGTH